MDEETGMISDNVHHMIEPRPKPANTKNDINLAITELDRKEFS